MDRGEYSLSALLWTISFEMMTRLSGNSLGVEGSWEVGGVFQEEGPAWARAQMCAIMASLENGEYLAVAQDSSASVERQEGNGEETGEAGDVSSKRPYLIQ